MIVDSITKGKNKTTMKNMNNVLFIHFHLRTKEANYICTIKYDDKATLSSSFFYPFSLFPSFKYITLIPISLLGILF